jgi:hypothetical protein
VRGKHSVYIDLPLRSCSGATRSAPELWRRNHSVRLRRTPTGGRSGNLLVIRDLQRDSAHSARRAAATRDAMQVCDHFVSPPIPLLYLHFAGRCVADSDNSPLSFL